MTLERTLQLIDRKKMDGALESYAIIVGYGGEERVILSDDVNMDSVFDIASLGKVFPTTPLALRAIGDGRLSLDDTLAKFFDGVPEDRAGVTVKNLLTHTSGMLRATYPDDVAKDGRESVLKFLFSQPLAYETGTRYAYCCDGLLLLGFILEKVYGAPLDELFISEFCRPLGLTRSSYKIAMDEENSVNCLTRLVMGESRYDDYNVRRLGGIPAGNGGNYSTPHDIREYVLALMRRDERLYSREMFDLAEQNFTAGMPVLDEFRGRDNHGLGFVHVNDACYQACELFPDGSIGHEGYTGQSFFLNRELGLYVIILSNATRCTVKRYGKARYEEVCDLRAELHREIGRDLGLIKE